MEKVDEVGTIPANEVTILLHGLKEKTVGIQGSERFTVTYSLLATVSFSNNINVYSFHCLSPV